jgi:MarR family 2-MHQ and catechol resistance regulon transcriptional repressor
MLALLKIHGPSKMTFFADQLEISSAAITGMADNMTAMELIERRAVPVDRRAYHLALTDKGRELLDKILP